MVKDRRSEVEDWRLRLAGMKRARVDWRKSRRSERMDA